MIMERMRYIEYSKIIEFLIKLEEHLISGCHLLAILYHGFDL